MSPNKVNDNTRLLNTYAMQIILNDKWLEDIYIDHFGLLLKSCSEYRPREVWRIQCPDTIESVRKDQKHIQILYSCSDMITNENGHWVCSYYDAKAIYIYDSLNLKRLHAYHKIYLEKLYPFYSFDKKPIRFPTVQNQSNAYDCGVFAIAFAVSLLFGLRPDTIMYDHSLMRQHLAQMFELNKIEHFPRIIRSTDLKQLFTLDQIERKKALANKKRKRRQKRAEQELSADLKLKSNITEMTLEESNKKHDNEQNDTNNFTICVQENKLLRDDNSCITTKINEHKYVSIVGDILPLSMQYIQIILRGEWLEDIHIDYFNLLLKNCSEYQPRESWKIQCPDRIEPVLKNQKHIQILHSCRDVATNLDGHWVCSYYDTNMIYIYDSLNIKRLHTHHKIYLEKLYPFYSFDKQSVQFPTVQSQPNGNDCGVFAIAFAVSLLFDLQPNRIIYDHKLMRQHLAEMFQSKKLEHFPQFAGIINSEQINHIYAINPNNIDNNTIDVTRDQHGIKRKMNSHNYRDSNKKQNKTSDICSENVLHKANVICTNKNSVLNKNYYQLRKNNLLTKKEKYNEKQRNDIKKSKKECYKKHTNDIKKLNKKYYEKHKNDIKKLKKEYYEKHKNDIKKSKKEYYKEHKNDIKKSQKEYYKLYKNNVLLRRKICYQNKIKLNNKSKQNMKYNKEKCIRNISKLLRMTSLSENRLEAERIAKWCFHIRKSYILQMRKTFNKCKQKIEVCLTRATECASLKFTDYIKAFCGQNKHTASSELYFAETTYRVYNISEPIIMNSEGKAINILPLIESKRKTRKAWRCSSYLVSERPSGDLPSHRHCIHKARYQHRSGVACHCVSKWH